MFTFEITFLPASLPSLANSYRRVRMVVGYPDGGTHNNMALAFLPGRVLEAGGNAYNPVNGTTSWAVPPWPPGIQRPSSNNGLAFMTVVNSTLTPLDNMPNLTNVLGSSGGEKQIRYSAERLCGCWCRFLSWGAFLGARPLLLWS